MNIKSVKNGFVVKTHSDGEEDEELVFEESDFKDELDNMADLLWYIKEYFAVFNSKHNEKNIVIKVEKNPDYI